MADKGVSAGGKMPGRVLVTGAGGQIGKALVNRLVDSGTDVTALDLHFAQPSQADRVIIGDATDESLVTDAMADV